MDKKPKEGDLYKEVVLQIKEVLEDDLFDKEQGFNEEKQNEIIRILKENFNIGDQQIGKIFMEDTTMFNKNTGEILDYGIPFFMSPLWLSYGYKIIMPNKSYPTYNIKNKYMGYMEGDKFFKSPSKIEAFMKSGRLGFIILYLLFIYIVLYIIINSYG